MRRCGLEVKDRREWFRRFFVRWPRFNHAGAQQCGPCESGCVRLWLTWLRAHWDVCSLAYGTQS